MSKIRALGLAVTLVAMPITANASKPVEIEPFFNSVRVEQGLESVNASGSYTVLDLLSKPINAHDTSIAARIAAEKAKVLATIEDLEAVVVQLEAHPKDSQGDVRKQDLLEKFKDSKVVGMGLFSVSNSNSSYFHVDKSVSVIKSYINDLRKKSYDNPALNLPKKAAVAVAAAVYAPRLRELKLLEIYASLLRINAASVKPHHEIRGTDSAYHLVEICLATKTRIAQLKARRLNDALADRLFRGDNAENFCKFGKDCSPAAQEMHLVPNEEGRQAHALNMYHMYKYLRVLLEREIIPEVKDPDMPVIDLGFDKTIDAKAMADHLKNFVIEREHKWRGRLTCDSSKLDLGLGVVIVPNLEVVMSYHFALSQPAGPAM